MAGFEGVGQVFQVQFDTESRFEVAIQHHGGFGIEHHAAGKSSPDCLVDGFGGHTGLCPEHQRLGHGCNIEGDNDLVGQLGDVSRADVAAMDDRRAHRAQDLDAAVEDFLLAAHHDGKSSIDRLRFSPAHRCVQHLDPFFGRLSSDLPRRQGRDRAHIDDDRPGLCAFENAVRTQDHFLDMGRIG